MRQELFPARRSLPPWGVIFAPYNIENLLMDGYDVVVNKPKTEAYRAPGGTNAVFAVETVVDELCEKLSIDPLEFRRLNGAHEGTRRSSGVPYPRIGLLEVIEAAQKHPHWTAPLTDPTAAAELPWAAGAITPAVPALQPASTMTAR